MTHHAEHKEPGTQERAPTLIPSSKVQGQGKRWCWESCNVATAGYRGVLMQKIKGTFLIQNVKNVNTINQGIENSIPKSFDSETNSESGFKGTKISSAIKLRKLYCLHSQAPKQSPFESAARPF